MNKTVKYATIVLGVAMTLGSIMMTNVFYQDYVADPISFHVSHPKRKKIKNEVSILEAISFEPISYYGNSNEYDSFAPQLQEVEPEEDAIVTVTQSEEENLNDTTNENAALVEGSENDDSSTQSKKNSHGQLTPVETFGGAVLTIFMLILSFSFTMFLVKRKKAKEQKEAKNKTK